MYSALLKLTLLSHPQILLVSVSLPEYARKYKQTVSFGLTITDTALQKERTNSGEHTLTIPACIEYIFIIIVGMEESQLYPLCVALRNAWF